MRVSARTCMFDKLGNKNQVIACKKVDNKDVRSYYDKVIKEGAEDELL